MSVNSLSKHKAYGGHEVGNSKEPGGDRLGLLFWASGVATVRGPGPPRWPGSWVPGRPARIHFDA